MIGTIRESVGSVFSGIKETIGGMIGTIRESVGSVFSGIKETIGGMIGTIRESVGSVFSGAKETIGGVVGTIRESIGSVFSGIKETIGGVTGTIRETIGNVFSGVKETIGGVIGTIRERIGSVFSGIKETIGGVWNGLKETVGGLFSGAKEMFSGIFGKKNGNRAARPGLRSETQTKAGKQALDDSTAQKVVTGQETESAFHSDMQERGLEMSMDPTFGPSLMSRQTEWMDSRSGMQKAKANPVNGKMAVMAAAMMMNLDAGWAQSPDKVAMTEPEPLRSAAVEQVVPGKPAGRQFAKFCDKVEIILPQGTPEEHVDILLNELMRRINDAVE